MIYTETITLNGKQYQRTYSDTYMVERDGVLYSEAIDPFDSGRAYTESDTLLHTDVNEATDADYQAALEEMGCSFDD